MERLNGLGEKNLKPGLSGMLRVKDEAKFLRLCVESCVNALDELVIIYQSCADDSPRIIEELAREYPDKIVTYFYDHDVSRSNLSDADIERLMNGPEDSKELFSTYSNTGLGLCTREYIMKIDSDQVYDEEWLSQISAAYRGEIKDSITIGEHLSYLWLAGMMKLNNIVDILCERTMGKHIEPFGVPGAGMVKRYRNYLLKRVSRSKWPISFSGFNLAITREKAGLSGGTYYDDGRLMPFNGVYDHVVFPNAEWIKFDRAVSRTRTEKYGNSVIEVLNYNHTLWKKTGVSARLLMGGFIWIHVDLHRHRSVLEADYPVMDFDSTVDEIMEKFRLMKTVSAKFWYKAQWREYLQNKSSRKRMNSNVEKILEINFRL